MARKSGHPPNLRHVIISGGARGVGLGLSERLLEGGYQVSSFSRRVTDDARRLVRRYPDRFVFEELDLTSSSTSAFVGRTVRRFGGLFGLVNNAAVATEGVLATLPEVEIRRMLSVNLDGAIILTRLALREMLKKKQPGRIINISSIVGTRGYTGLAVYSATKAGLDGFTRSLSRELGRRGITVNSVAPGYMRTEMSAGLAKMKMQQIVNRTPLGRLADVRDVVSTVAFLLSDDASFITGQTILVDGGVSN